MTIEQLSIFVENKPGRIADITDTLFKAGIDMRAMSIADTTDFGILRLIVDRTEDAKRVLTDADFIVSVNEVIAVSIGDRPGSLNAVLNTLAEAEISIEYLYAFITRRENAAYVVIRVDNNEKAEKLLTEKGFTLAGADVLSEN